MLQKTLLLHRICNLYKLITLVYLIIVKAGKFPEINKQTCNGCNKAVQVGIFQESIVKNMQGGKISEVNKSAGCNKAVQVGFFQKNN